MNEFLMSSIYLNCSAVSVYNYYLISLTHILLQKFKLFWHGNNKPSWKVASITYVAIYILILFLICLQLQLLKKITYIQILTFSLDSFPLDTKLWRVNWCNLYTCWFFHSLLSQVMLVVDWFAFFFEVHIATLCGWWCYLSWFLT